MQRANVGNPEEKVSTDLKRARNLVKDPKDLLGVLKNLVGHNQVSLRIRKRQRVALNVGQVNLVSLTGESLGVFSSAFYRDQFRLRMESLDDLQISSRTRS